MRSGIPNWVVEVPGRGSKHITPASVSLIKKTTNKFSKNYNRLNWYSVMRQNQQQIIKYHDCVESTLCRLLTASVFNFKLCFQGRLPECHKVKINPRPMGRQRGKEVNTSKWNTWKVKQERYLTKCSLPSQIQTTERILPSTKKMAHFKQHVFENNKLSGSLHYFMRILRIPHFSLSSHFTMIQ